jgi:hypothetical protein
MTSAASTGSWVVCIRDLPSNTDEYLGYFRSEDRAEAVARRLRGDVEAVGASHVIDVTVCFVRPMPEHEDARDELLADLEEMGYAVQR